MLLISFWQVLVFLVAIWSLKQAKNEGEVCVVHGKVSWSSITWRIQALELHSPIPRQSSMQGRESEKKSSNQEFRIACEIKRSFKSCRIESKNEWKKFHTLCEILHTMRNLLRQQRISHTMPNLAWYTKSSCALTPLDFYLHIFCVIS